MTRKIKKCIHCIPLDSKKWIRASFRSTALVRLVVGEQHQSMPCYMDNNLIADELKIVDYKLIKVQCELASIRVPQLIVIYICHLLHL